MVRARVTGLCKAWFLMGDLTCSSTADEFLGLHFRVYAVIKPVLRIFGRNSNQWLDISRAITQIFS
jgi:hypothetical protein